jgi:2-C-methyl-D-erythritol 4-phosphate cytidylyltransferase
MLKNIKNAYNISFSPEITDDATVAERYGLKIHLFEGTYENLKITTSADLKIAEVLLSERNKKSEL